MKEIKINWLKYRFIYFSISISMIIIGVFSLLKWGIVKGIDFVGGTNIEYKITNNFSTEKAIENLKKDNFEVSSIQSIGEGNYLFKFNLLESNQKETIKSIIETTVNGPIEEIRYETVGPSFGPELIKKTVYAVSIAALVILLWVAFQFKSIKFGTSAILAMFHDTFILIGSFSLLGHFFGYEFDYLFVTALLTTLSFSVHDTIVVFDRIRELKKKHGGSIASLANEALTETMRRSINNSVTIALMLVSLSLFGGESVRPFALALLIGTILGTYSSPFVAVPIMVTWDSIFHSRK